MPCLPVRNPDVSQSGHLVPGILLEQCWDACGLAHVPSRSVLRKNLNPRSPHNSPDHCSPIHAPRPPTINPLHANEPFPTGNLRATPLCIPALHIFLHMLLTSWQPILPKHLLLTGDQCGAMLLIQQKGPKQCQCLTARPFPPFGLCYLAVSPTSSALALSGTQV